MYRDLTGMKFGRLTVMSLSHINKEQDYQVYWNCLCDCGNKKICSGKVLKGKDRTRSCGCIRAKIPVTCGRCGKQIMVIQSRARYAKKNLFCDWECKKDPNMRNISADGYYVINANGVAMREHRHVMEVHLGRKLLSTEIVHHINENKLDNRLENLAITNRADHAREHNVGKRKTHCIRGHEYNGENTYINTNGYRECNTCRAFHRQTQV